MLQRDDGRFFVDENLTSNRRWLEGDLSLLDRFKILAANVRNPASSHFGKPANAFEFITQKRPLLVGGDSDGDFANLVRARNRLWITRLQTPENQTEVVPITRRHRRSTWMMQPALTNQNPGFVRSRSQLTRRMRDFSAADRAAVQQAIRAFRGTGLLTSWMRG
jgi:hypothetical protein